MSFTIREIKEELLRCYKIDPMHVTLVLSTRVGGIESDENTLEQCQFRPHKDFAVMFWIHPFWNFSAIYGINMKEMIFFDTGKNDQFKPTDKNKIEDNYRRFKYQYSVRIDPEVDISSIAIDKDVHMGEVESKLLSLDEIKRLRCILPIVYEWKNDTYNRVRNKIPEEDDILRVRSCNYKSNSICLYSSALLAVGTHSYYESCRCTHIEYKVKLINPIGVTIGFTTGSQIWKQNSNLKYKLKLTHRNDILSNNEIYAINCETSMLFSHRKFENVLFDDNLKFNKNDTITIRLNLVHNHITICKNDEWIGIAFEEVIMDRTNCRLVVCMESNHSHVVVEDYYPAQQDLQQV